MSNELLDLVTRGESGAAGYNAYNRGTYKGADGKQHIRGADHPIDFSQMTIGQLSDTQHLPRTDPNRLFAVGRYQVIPDTMDGAIAALNLDRSQKFTPEVQDQIFNDYLIVKGAPAVHDYITGKAGVTVTDAQRALSHQWASFGDPDHQGRSYYGGANHASITLAESQSALEHMRAAYQADIAKGMTPQQAWAAVTDSTPNQQQNTQAPHAAQAHHAAQPHARVMEQGDRGADVHRLQADLARLGYKDAHGHLLHADSNFGPNTKHAVEAFQRDHHLTVDGKAGPRTLAAMQHDLQQHQQPRHASNGTPTMDQPGSPDNAMYKQALDAVHKLDAQHGRTPDQGSNNLAASLVASAKHDGLTRIDHIALSDDGSKAFAVQGDVTSPFKKMAEVNTAQAVGTPIAQSSQAAQQATPAQVTAPHLAPQAQQQAQQQANPVR